MPDSVCLCVWISSTQPMCGTWKTTEIAAGGIEAVCALEERLVDGIRASNQIWGAAVAAVYVPVRIGDGRSWTPSSILWAGWATKR